MTETLPVLEALSKRFPARVVTADGAAWTIRDTSPDATGQTPLMLLPGALGTGDTFHLLLTALAPTHRLIACTFPPVGNAAALATGFIALLDALGLNTVDILGTSLGGYVAQEVALQQPVRVRKLLLANTFYDPERQQSRWPSAQDYAKLPESEVLAATLAQIEAGAAATSEEKALKRLMLDLVGKDQCAAHIKAMRLAVLTAVPLARVPLPGAAITVIDDDNDPVIAPPTREQMRTRYANCRQLRIEGGGHFPVNLQPRQYQDAIRAALQN